MKIAKIVKIVLFALLAAVIVAAGENLNGIYLGGDVSGYNGQIIAVQITEDGTVIAWRGVEVPLMHDRLGKPVHIRRIELR